MPEEKVEYSFLENIRKNWTALAVIGAIIAASITGWNYAMAQAAETAEVTVKATVNKAMIDGAKDAAAQAVKEQLPAIAKQVAQEVAKEIVKQQREEAKAVKASATVRADHK